MANQQIQGAATRFEANDPDFADHQFHPGDLADGTAPDFPRRGVFGQRPRQPLANTGFGEDESTEHHGVHTDSSMDEAEDNVENDAGEETAHAEEMMATPSAVPQKSMVSKLIYPVGGLVIAVIVGSQVLPGLLRHSPEPPTIQQIQPPPSAPIVSPQAALAPTSGSGYPQQQGYHSQQIASSQGTPGQERWAAPTGSAQFQPGQSAVGSVASLPQPGSVQAGLVMRQPQTSAPITTTQVSPIVTSPGLNGPGMVDGQYVPDPKTVQEIDALRVQIKQLRQDQTAGFSKANAAQDTLIKSLTSKVDSLETQVNSTINQRMDSLSAQISAVSNEVESLKTAPDGVGVVVNHPHPLVRRTAALIHRAPYHRPEPAVRHAAITDHVLGSYKLTGVSSTEAQVLTPEGQRVTVAIGRVLHNVGVAERIVPYGDTWELITSAGVIRP